MTPLTPETARVHEMLRRVEMAHNRCADPTAPRQAVGEMLAAILSDFRDAPAPTTRAYLAEHEPALLAALVEWGAEAKLRYPQGDSKQPLIHHLMAAIERSGLIPAAPGTTDATFWLGEDA